MQPFQYKKKISSACSSKTSASVTAKFIVQVSEVSGFCYFTRLLQFTSHTSTVQETIPDQNRKQQGKSSSPMSSNSSISSCLGEQIGERNGDFKVLELAV